MLSIIVAIANENVIGKDNQLIWHLPEDLKRFKEITTGHKIIMGRKTFESLGRVLPNRKHIILCNDNKYIELVLEINSIKEVITKNNDVMAFIKASDEYRQLDITLFPKVYQDNKKIEIYDIIKIYGRVEKRFDNYQIIASKIINLTRSNYGK